MVTTAESVLQDAPAGELVLRICGSSRDGQVLRLRSPKCTIGSGDRCTVRLHAAGIRPVHCLIVRGDRATVVRRWTPDTRLNGHAFDDAELAAGDRLTVGPVEFEVLDAAAQTPADEAPPADPDKPDPAAGSQIEALRGRLRRTASQGRRRVRRLLDQLRSDRRRLTALELRQDQSLSEHAGQLADICQELQSQRESFSRQEEQWQAERADLETRLNQQTADGLAEWQTERQRMEVEHAEWDRQRDETQRDLEHRAQDLAARQAELDALSQALHEQHEQWEIEREQSETRLAAAQQEIETRQRELDRRTEEFESQTEDREAQASQFDQRTEELEARSGELEAQAEQLEARAGEIDAKAEEIDARAEEIEGRAQQIEELSREHEARAQEAEARREEIETRLAAAQQEIEARQRELDRRAEEFESQTEDREAQASQFDQRKEELEARSGEIEARAREIGAKAEEIDARAEEMEGRARQIEELSAKLEAESQELEARREAFESRLAIEEPQGDPGEEELPGEDADPSGWAAHRDSPTEVRFEDVSADSPLTSEEVFRRLGTVPLLRDDDEGEGEVLPAAETRTSRMPTESTAEMPASAAREEAEDDDSIDAYMTRLLRRVGSDVEEPQQPLTAPAAPAAPKPAALPEPEVSLQAEAPTETVPAGLVRREPVEMSPRAAAPERTEDLSAMRELANLSAHQAIDSYAKRMTSRSARGKLAVTTVSLAAGAVLTWLWWTAKADRVALWAAVTSFMVSLFWCLQHVFLATRHRTGSSKRRNEQSLEPTPSDEQETDDAPDEP